MEPAQAYIQPCYMGGGHDELDEDDAFFLSLEDLADLLHEQYKQFALQEPNNNTREFRVNLLRTVRAWIPFKSGLTQ